MPKKLLPLSIIVVLISMVPVTSSAVQAQDTVSVALLLPGPITDGGWDQLAYEGLVELGDEEGFEVAFTENITQAQIPEITRGYADDGYDLLIGHGFEFGSAFLEIAPDYPDQLFFASTFQPQEDVPENLLYIDMAYFDAAYGAGALAALLSDNGIVGFVGGGDNPTQQNMMDAYIMAAGDTVEDTMGLGIITGDDNDAAKGREAAVTMIGNGADVIWHAADVTGLGAIEGALAEGAQVIGCYSDQTDLAPDQMGTSLVMDLGPMVVTLGHMVRDGEFVGGTEWQPSVTEMWHWAAGEDENGELRAYNPELISDEVWEQFSDIWDAIDAGEIDATQLLKEAEE